MGDIPYRKGEPCQVSRIPVPSSVPFPAHSLLSCPLVPVLSPTPILLLSPSPVPHSWSCPPLQSCPSSCPVTPSWSVLHSSPVPPTPPPRPVPNSWSCPQLLSCPLFLSCLPAPVLSCPPILSRLPLLSRPRSCLAAPAGARAPDGPGRGAHLTECAGALAGRVPRRLRPTARRGAERQEGGDRGRGRRFIPASPAPTPTPRPPGGAAAPRMGRRGRPAGRGCGGGGTRGTRGATAGRGVREAWRGWGGRGGPEGPRRGRGVRGAGRG